MPHNISALIKRIPGNEDLPLPQYHSSEAAGMDLQAAVKDTVAVPPGKVCVIPTGFSIALSPEYEGQIRPRSGLATKSFVTVVNSPGTIDADYRGEISVALINLGQATFDVSRGLRIAQLIVSPVARVTWREVSDLPVTARGAGGFGHTGA